RAPRRADRLRPLNTADRRCSLGQVLPRDVLVDPDLRGEAEHALGDDVAQDLRGAALDRVALGAQVAVSRAAAREVDRGRPVGRPPLAGPVVVAQALLAEQVDL